MWKAYRSRAALTRMTPPADKPLHGESERRGHGKRRLDFPRGQLSLWKIWFWGAGALHGVLLAAAAAAQNAPGLPSREELNPARRAEAARPAADLFTAPAAGPCPFAESALTVTLREVRFTGLTGVPAAMLRDAYAGFIGKPGSLATLCAIRDRVGAALFRQGLLARVEIPEQRITDGVLTLDVIEANVAAVRVTGDGGPAARRIETYARKLRGMKPFDLDTAQRYLLLAAETPGIRLRTIVRPDPSGARGAIDIEIRVERDAVTGVVNAQNQQPKTAGRFGALARVDINSLTELGERTSLVYYHTVPDDEQFVVQGIEEVRLGGDGLVARGSLAYGETRPGADLKRLALRSISTVANLELAYPLVKLRRRELTVAGGFELASQSAKYRGAGPTLTEDDLRILYVRAAVEARPWFGPRQGSFGGEVMLRKGISGLGASDRGTTLVSRVEGKPDAFVARASADALFPAARLFSLHARIEAQYSGSALLSYEELPLGNLTIGRGYDPASATGDSGIAGALEARFGPFEIPGRVLVAPYAFGDIGCVTNHDALQADRTLKAAGVGAQIRVGPRLIADVAYAHPFDAPQPGASHPSDRVLVNVTFGL